jgi:hypothetical protein
MLAASWFKDSRHWHKSSSSGIGLRLNQMSKSLHGWRHQFRTRRHSDCAATQVADLSRQFPRIMFGSATWPAASACKSSEIGGGAAGYAAVVWPVRSRVQSAICHMLWQTYHCNANKFRPTSLWQFAEMNSFFVVVVFVRNVPLFVSVSQF